MYVDLSWILNYYLYYIIYLENLSPSGVPVLRSPDVLLPLLVQYPSESDNTRSGDYSDRNSSFLSTCHSTWRRILGYIIISIYILMTDLSWRSRYRSFLRRCRWRCRRGNRSQIWRRRRWRRTKLRRRRRTWRRTRNRARIAGFEFRRRSWWILRRNYGESELEREKCYE